MPNYRTTIQNALRKYKPGIYGDPVDLVGQAQEQMAPESPAMARLFGVRRGDLAEMAAEPGDLEDLYTILPGAKQKPRGTDYAYKVTKPANTQRLIDVLEAAEGTPLSEGMRGWYEMRPVHERMVALMGEEEAAEAYDRLNKTVGIFSANAEVPVELQRGTAAHWLAKEGRLDDWLAYGGAMDMPGRPEDMGRVPGHMGHKTSHGIPLRNLEATGDLQMQTPKVPAYIHASGVPGVGSGRQNVFPVGDAHFSRAIGLSDVRPEAASKDVGASWTMTEAQELAPWFTEKIARETGRSPVEAQAELWGVMAPQTGVTTPIGAPKLELLSEQIMRTADRLDVTPEMARDMVLTGKTYAGRADPTLLAGMAGAGTLAAAGARQPSEPSRGAERGEEVMSVMELAESIQEETGAGDLWEWIDYPLRAAIGGAELVAGLGSRESQRRAWDAMGRTADESLFEFGADVQDVAEENPLLAPYSRELGTAAYTIPTMLWPF